MHNCMLDEIFHFLNQYDLSISSYNWVECIFGVWLLLIFSSIKPDAKLYGSPQPYGWGICRPVLLCYYVPFCQIFVLFGSPLAISGQQQTRIIVVALHCLSAAISLYENTDNEHKKKLTMLVWIPLVVAMLSFAFDKAYWPTIKQLPQTEGDKRISKYFYCHLLS